MRKPVPEPVQRLGKPSQAKSHQAVVSTEQSQAMPVCQPCQPMLCKLVFCVGWAQVKPWTQLFVHSVLTTKTFDWYLVLPQTHTTVGNRGGIGFPVLSGLATLVHQWCTRESVQTEYQSQGRMRAELCIHSKISLFKGYIITCLALYWPKVGPFSNIRK